MNRMLLIMGASILLNACDFKENINQIGAGMPKPNIILGAGTVLKLSETETAEVFGPDLCESGFEDNNPKDNTSGCTILTNHESVEVTLIVEGKKPFKEVWAVSVGPNKSGYQLTRPNGWMVLSQPFPISDSEAIAAYKRLSKNTGELTTLIKNASSEKLRKAYILAGCTVADIGEYVSNGDKKSINTAANCASILSLNLQK